MRILSSAEAVSRETISVRRLMSIRAVLGSVTAKELEQQWFGDLLVHTNGFEEGPSRADCVVLWQNAFSHVSSFPGAQSPCYGTGLLCGMYGMQGLHCSHP
jgi:hypothetical protein